MVNKEKIYITSQVGIWRIVAVLMPFLSSFPERHGNTHGLVDSEKIKGKDQQLQRADLLKFLWKLHLSE